MRSFCKAQIISYPPLIFKPLKTVTGHCYDGIFPKCVLILMLCGLEKNWFGFFSIISKCYYLWLVRLNTFLVRMTWASTVQEDTQLFHSWEANLFLTCRVMFIWIRKIIWIYFLFFSFLKVSFKWKNKVIFRLSKQT